jgi:glycosyltransferase involved in cell wall biosynthesis
MNEMRVLHLRKSEGFYGAEKVILALSGGMRGRGVQSWIGCINDSRNPCPVLFDEANRTGLPALLLPCAMRFDPSTLRNIVTRARSLKIGIIHCHGFKADFYGFLAGRRLGIPVISTQHGWTHSNRLIRVWERADLILLRRFSRVAAVSSEIEMELLNRGVAPAGVITVTNGISMPDLRGRSDDFLESQGASRKNVMIGIVGRLSVEKGHRDFLQAVGRVAHARPEARFWIVGSGTLRDKLEAYSRKLGVSGVVRFLGFRGDMETIYAHLDIVVSASLREGIPIALLEAMAMARPVIATRVGGIPSIIDDGVSGILVPPQDPETLADRILDLLIHPERRKEIGRSARQKVAERFSSERMCGEYISIYRESLAER